MTRLRDASEDWRDVYRRFKDNIDRATLAPGADLPTIGALAKSTGLTPYGARRVLERLKSEDLAQSWQGKGYRVAFPRLTLSMRERRPTFTEQVRAQGYAPSSELLSGRAVALPHSLSRRAKKRAGTKVIRTETVRKVNGVPVALSVDYFLQQRMEGIVETVADLGSISNSLSMLGVDSYHRDRTSIEARLPTAHESVTLEIPRSQPVYATIGANLTQDGAIFQISTGLWRADCVSYEA